MTASTPTGEGIGATIEAARRFAAERPDIRAVALVGSRARGTAGLRSDIDLLVLSDDPDAYLASGDWIAALGALELLATRARGSVTEHRLRLDRGPEIDFAVGRPAWASTDPADPNTARVVDDGFRILYDPDHLLLRLRRRLDADRGCDEPPSPEVTPSP
jgi:predicted nucleotidyltransferase